MEEHEIDLPSPSTQPGGLPPSLETLIERWWEDHFPGSLVARDTEAWNVAHAAKETLKGILARAWDAVMKGSL